MNISTQTQAVLLLTAWLTKPAKDDPKPLTPAEWGRFAVWLRNQGKTPESLVTGDPLDCLRGWLDPSVTMDRVRRLLERSGALGLALEKWQRAGLWVMTRADTDYPTRLKRRLKLDAPPILFGGGNRQLLDQGGIAVVGSRAAQEEEIRYTSQLGAEIAKQGFSVVSGGAQGVDEAAMLGALAHEGTVVGVLADSLLRASTLAKYRQSLLSKNLVLVSPFNPEAGFNVGNAMARNQYIYCLADAGIVVTTSKGSGGTWSGAVENLKHGWVPLWVKSDPDPDSGNAALVQRGARWLPTSELAVDSLNFPEKLPQPVTNNFAISTNSHQEKLEGSNAQDELSFYEIFLRRLGDLTSEAPLSLDDLLQRLDVSKTQMNDWLKRAEAEGRVNKLKKPVRYTSTQVGQQKLALEG
jgi:predicted Rossmann fold nucleotide-binding protein DprA/Smf involved in DNA uptake